jgi:hypothetical protein
LREGARFGGRPFYFAERSAHALFHDASDPIVHIRVPVTVLAGILDHSGGGKWDAEEQ